MSHLTRIGNGGERAWVPPAAWVLARKQPVRSAQREHISPLMHEINHRSKNMLALVQAIARFTAVANPHDFISRFEERIQALAASQELLVKNEWKSVDLEELVRSQLAHFRDLIGTRIELDGPAAFISAHAARTIGMALHELATNAVKYGALSTADGFVEVGWSLQRLETGNETFVMSWRERGGPPVTAPSSQGFGSTVISAMPAHSLDAAIELSFPVTGLTWRLRCPAAEVLSDKSAPGGWRTARPESSEVRI